MIRINSLVTIFLIIMLCIIGVAFNSLAVCRIIVLLLAAICIMNGRSERKIINPYYLFALTPISLILYSNISSNYMVDLNIKTWLLAILNMGAFIGALNFGPSAKQEPSPYDVDDNTSIGNHILILSILAFVPLYLNTFIGISLPLYSTFSLFYIPALMCAIYSKNKKWVIFVLVLTMVPWFRNVSKSTILTVFIALLVAYEAYYQLSTKARIRLAALCTVAVVVMLYSFTFANQLRGTRTAEGQLHYYTKYGNVKWSGSTILFMPYMYFTTPWANLQYVMQTQNTRTYGLWLIRPLISYFQMDEHFASQYVLIPKSSFNTFGFIAPHFKDFGFWGSTISTIILGIFVKWVYTRSEATERPLDVACYAFCAQAVLQMFFSNHYFQQCYPFTIVIIVGLYRFLYCGRLRFGKRGVDKDE